MVRFVLILIFCFGSIVESTALADTERDLRVAVANMTGWLGADDKARQWREYLDLNILDTQSAMGHRADPQVLTGILQKFERDVDGLKHPVFRRVRQCIDAHIDQLQSSRSEITFSAEQSKSEFENLALSDLNTMRDDAVFRVQMLKRYYRQRLLSRERALLFYEFRPDETIEYLSSLKFELPPARTAKIINSEIDFLRLEIEKVDNQLKELNKQLEKINEWKNNLDRPDDVEPPSPDDETKPNSTSTALLNEPQDEIERIQNGQLILEHEKLDLDDKIKQREEELVNLKSDEAERLQRFRDWREQYLQLEDGYATVAPSRKDVYFAQAYDSLKRLRLAYFAAANPRLESDFEKRIDAIKEEYANVLAGQDRRAFARLGNLTGWLDAAGQATDLVSAVRAQHSLPNMFFEITSDFVNQLARQEISEYRRVNDQVLSRLIRGIALVEGAAGVHFIPDDNQARLSIDFMGTVKSDTFVRSGRLTAYAGGDVDFGVHRELFANVGGMFARDIFGCLNLDSYFKCIDSNLSLVQRIARKQFQKTEALAERIAGERTKEQIFDQFQQQTDELLDGGFERLANLNEGQTDNGRFLPALFMFTTDDRLVAVGHHATMYDLGANNRPQRFDEIPADIRFKLNETMISNYISPIFAGRRMSNKQLTEEIASLLQREPRESETDQDFNVAFDDARPIQIEFEENLFGVTITGVFQRAGSRTRNNLRIQLKFRLESDGDSLSIVPAEDVKIELVDPTKKNIGTASMISFLERIMTDVITKSEDAGQSFPTNLIPTQNMQPELKEIVERLMLTQFRLENSWLYAGWKYQPEHSLYSGLVDRFAIATATSKIDPAAANASDGLDLSDQVNELDGDRDSSSQ